MLFEPINRFKDRMNLMTIQKLCKHCCQSFNAVDSRKIFCSKSCSAKFNNSNRVRTEESKSKLSSLMKSKFKDGNLFVPSRPKRIISKNYEINLSSKVKSCRINYCAICTKIFRQLTEQQETCSKKCGTEWTKHRRRNGQLKPTGGLREKSGRGKSGWYKGYFCNSTWELAYVIYNIDHDISFTRNTTGYKYFNPDKTAWFTYYPDFLVGSNFVEIKGFKTKLDDYKISGVNDRPVVIMYKSDLKNVFDYVKAKYSKSIENIYELYEDHRPYFEKICNFCNKPFVTNKKTKVLCSRICAGRHAQTLRHKH